MDQDSEPWPPPGSGRGAAGGDHDITRHQALEQHRLAAFDVRRFDRDPDDAPSLNFGPFEPPLHQGRERRRTAPRLRRRLEAQDIHLPVPLFPDQEAAGPIQAGYGVRAQEHLGQRAQQAARSRTRLSQRARRFALRRSRKSRTTP